MSSKDNDKLINFYTIKKVQKHMPKFNDTQKKFTGMPIQKHILICGQTGAGKTQTLLNYLYRAGESSRTGQYHSVMLVFKTYEPLYKYLESEMGDSITLYNNKLEALPPVDKFPDSSDTNTKQRLIIFDDCVNDKEKCNVKKIQEYYTYGRKKGFTIIFLSQSYFKTDIFYRQQSSFVLLSSVTNKTDLRLILNDCAGLYCELEQLKKMIDYSMEREDDDDCPFFKIDKQPKTPLDKKFSKNFLEYLDPDDFKPSRSKKQKQIIETESETDDDDEDPNYREILKGIPKRK
jgi:hypothetical protein